jgi:hypothetical protein
VVRHESSGWRMASASLELPRLRFASTAPVEPPSLATVVLRHDTATPLQGDIDLQGARLGSLYPLLGIPPSVELMLAPFREQPFSASAGRCWSSRPPLRSACHFGTNGRTSPCVHPGIGSNDSVRAP